MTAGDFRQAAEDIRHAAKDGADPRKGVRRNAATHAETVAE